jgi:ferrous iron transport protein A
MAHQITLDQLPLGNEGTVVQVNGDKKIKRRLLDMGMVSGTPVTMKAVAPLGDPLEVIIKGYQLSLRKHEANKILIEVAA